MYPVPETIGHLQVSHDLFVLFILPFCGSGAVTLHLLVEKRDQPANLFLVLIAFFIIKLPFLQTGQLPKTVILEGGFSSLPPVITRALPNWIPIYFSFCSKNVIAFFNSSLASLTTVVLVDEPVSICSKFFSIDLVISIETMLGTYLRSKFITAIPRSVGLMPGLLSIAVVVGFVLSGFFEVLESADVAAMVVVEVE